MLKMVSLTQLTVHHFKVKIKYLLGISISLRVWFCYSINDNHSWPLRPGRDIDVLKTIQLWVLLLVLGPCQPSGIEAVTDCEADSATISWQPSVGAVSYVAELTASSGHATRCATNHTNCELSSLQCGEEYNVTVKALGHSCNITAQMPGYLPSGTVWVCFCGISQPDVSLEECHIIF